MYNAPPKIHYNQKICKIANSRFEIFQLVLNYLLVFTGFLSHCGIVVSMPPNLLALLNFFFLNVNSSGTFILHTTEFQSHGLKQSNAKHSQILPVCQPGLINKQNSELAHCAHWNALWSFSVHHFKSSWTPIFFYFRRKHILEDYSTGSSPFGSWSWGTLSGKTLGFDEVM